MLRLRHQRLPQSPLFAPVMRPNLFLLPLTFHWLSLLVNQDLINLERQWGPGGHQLAGLVAWAPPCHSSLPSSLPPSHSPAPGIRGQKAPLAMARRGQLVPGPQGQARGREQSPAQGQARGQALVPARARTPGWAQAQDAVPAPGIQQSQGREVGAKGHSLWGASSLWGGQE